MIKQYQTKPEGVRATSAIQCIDCGYPHGFVLGDSADDVFRRAKGDRERAERAREKKAPPQAVVKLWPDSTNNCVVWAKRYANIDKVLGYAGHTVPEGTTPKIMAIALFKHYGHAGVVTAIDGDVITVIDSNWLKGWITEHRLSPDDLRGYIYR